MAERTLDYDAIFANGMKSNQSPGRLPAGFYWLGENVINAGGMISCRPGFHCKIQLPEGNLQGAGIFRPAIGLEQIVIAIDGKLYVTAYPFDELKQISNVQLNPNAREVYFCQAEKSVQRIGHELLAPLEFIKPIRLLIIQDGGFSAPIIWDGCIAVHSRNEPFGIPTGGPMAWVGDRLWVARDNYLFASDISDPISFREQISVASIEAFVFPETITALHLTPGLGASQLLVFTEHTTSLIKANVRVRESWIEVEDMQQQILSIGATSHRAVISHFGLLAWFSPIGVIFFDTAMQARLSSRLPVQDDAMYYSKAHLSGDLRSVCAGAYGSFMLFSVPYEDTYNSHTWVLNSASVETGGGPAIVSWASIWTGIRPVTWLGGKFGNVEQLYVVSHDKDGTNRLWRAFEQTREDAGCPITWALYTRGYFGPASGTTRLPDQKVRFSFAEIGLEAIDKTLDLGVFVAASSRGSYKKILATRLNVAAGNIDSQNEYSLHDDEWFATKGASILLRTEKADRIFEETGVCAEFDETDTMDTSFQLLIIGQGPATIQSIRVFGNMVQESFDSASHCLNKNQTIALNLIGFGVAGASEQEALTNLVKESGGLRQYSSTKTYEITRYGLVGAGLASAVSYISQEAADRVALEIAKVKADRALISALPPYYSS